MDRIVELRKLLEHYNYLYYVKNEPEITDQKFDELMHELERLEAEHPEMFDPLAAMAGDIHVGKTHGVKYRTEQRAVHSRLLTI